MNLDPRAREPRKENGGKNFRTLLSVFYDAHLIVKAMGVSRRSKHNGHSFKPEPSISQCQHCTAQLIQKVMTTKSNSHVQLSQLY